MLTGRRGEVRGQLLERRKVLADPSSGADHHDTREHFQRLAPAQSLGTDFKGLEGHTGARNGA
ncbi:hypothetical protein D3C81_1928420 [compost metagenome]